MHYAQCIPRIEIKQDVLVRKHYNDTGSSFRFHTTNLGPQQLSEDLLHVLHGKKLIIQTKSKWFMKFHNDKMTPA